MCVKLTKNLIGQWAECHKCGEKVGGKMLKIDRIEFWLGDYATYTIPGHHIESFPLLGGTPSRMITTQVWNQHGSTFVESFMDSQDSELIFISFIRDMADWEMESDRFEITQICNPLNGIMQMKVFLSSGSIFNRDIAFISAPIFPTGRENRNDIWQKCQLQFEALNPFWYSEQEIVETFQAVESLFTFPFEMSAAAPVNFGNILPNNIAENTGHAFAPVTIFIYGACVNPRIDNITTGEYLKFNNLTMVADDTLEIKTAFGEKGVWLNGQSIFNKLDFNSTFFSLQPGQNEIQFTDETNSTTSSIHFIYKPLYLTI